jgi:hypothetical protein
MMKQGAWEQDGCHSTMAHFVSDGKPVCGATLCGRTTVKNAYQFTGFCPGCSEISEGHAVPSWAADAESVFRREFFRGTRRDSILRGEER